jgi:hypothetical protein
MAGTQGGRIAQLSDLLDLAFGAYAIYQENAIADSASDSLSMFDFVL